MSAPTLRLIDGKTEFPFRTQAGGQWPPLEGVVRPASTREVRAHDARVRDAQVKLGTVVAGKAVGHDEVEAEVVQIQAAFYAPRIVSWNIDMPVTPEAVAVLPWEIFRQLDAIVAGAAGLVLGNSAATSPS